MKLAKTSLLFFLFLSFSFLLKAQVEAPKPDDAIEKPAKIYPVNDFAGLFTPQERETLNQKLIEYADSTSTEIVIITVKSLNGAPIEDVAAETGDYWKIGQEDKDNGIIVLISENDRKMTIRTGYGTQVVLTPTMSKIIIDKIITPNFRNGDFYKGLDEGTTAMMEALAGQFNNDVPTKSNNIPWDLIIIGGLILLFIIMNSRGGGRGGRGGRGVIFTDFGSSSWSGGGGFGGFGGGGGGGGFGGFGGGGGFSGGGASGGW